MNDKEKEILKLAGKLISESNQPNVFALKLSIRSQLAMAGYWPDDIEKAIKFLIDGEQ